MNQVPLHNGLVVVVDDDDFDLVSQWHWTALRKGKNWYAVRRRTRALAGVTSYTAFDDRPAECLKRVLVELGWAFDSPLEQMFWNEWQKSTNRPTLDIQTPVLGGKYRIDFTHGPTKTAIELDGFEFHATREGFANDHKRQRALQADGWKIIRFTGREVHQDIARCVDEVARFIQG